MCQISYLDQLECEAASFQQSESSCQLFINIPDPNSNLPADMENYYHDRHAWNATSTRLV